MSKLVTSFAAVAMSLAILAPASTALAGGAGTGADIQVSGSASTGSPTAGTPFSYTFRVKDSGPDAAAATLFTGTLPAGMVYNSATVNNLGGLCSAAPDASGNNIVTCSLGTMASGAESSVLLNVTAPPTASTFSVTGTARSSIADPQPTNNSVTVSVRTATCTLPAGQTAMTGLVMAKYTNSSGLFEDFQLSVNGVNYKVITNFYDGTAPLTTVINLNCRQVPNTFIQGGNFVTVSGTVGSVILPGATTPTPVIYASVVQVPVLFDKI